MKARKSQAISARPHETMTSAIFAHQARAMVLYHGERILGEIPTAIRRVGTLLLVLSITLPIFLAAVIVVLWRLAG
jgi:hypothetical protein